MGDNVIKYGLENVYYAPITAVTDTAYTYSTPVKLDGAVTLSLDANGESVNVYADNVLKKAININNGYTGELEILIANDAFKAAVLGEQLVDGVLIESATDSPVDFALAFQFTGDVNNVRYWLYRCQCSRPSVSSSSTTESMEAATDTLSFSAMPRTTDKKIKAVCENTTANATKYASWFSAVYETEEV